MACGLWMGGRHPMLLIQNTGLLESGDAFRGTAMRMRIPLVSLVTYRGYAKMMKHLRRRSRPRRRRDAEPLGRRLVRADDRADAAGLGPLLRLRPRRARTCGKLTAAFERARTLPGPVAVLVTGDTT